MEKTIISNLLMNERYCREILPFIDPAYFSEKTDRVLVEEIGKFVSKYNKRPTKDALKIIVEDVKGLNDEQYNECIAEIDQLNCDPDTDYEWLRDKTEEFCIDRATYNAIRESVLIYEGGGKKDRGAIPELLSSALAVSFDSSIGHDYIEDAAKRQQFYQMKEFKVPFGVDALNRITNGGISKKSLTVFMAGTGVGKSMVMCDMAAKNLLDGLDVLYITMEMSEEKISERIDANLLNVDIQDIPNLDKFTFQKKIDNLKLKTTGRLVVKEYPTSSASVLHFKNLLSELRLKKKFKPSIIYIDYLNICTSSRIKMSGNTNSYTFVKMIAEELRGLAVEYDVPVVSATQVNREGLESSDIGLNNTSESMGLAHTCDLFLAIISTEELEKLGQIMFKQLKNRYGDLNFMRRFTVGVERSKMRLFDLDDPLGGLMPDDIDGGSQDEAKKKFLNRKKKW